MDMAWWEWAITVAALVYLTPYILVVAAIALAAVTLGLVAAFSVLSNLKARITKE